MIKRLELLLNFVIITTLCVIIFYQLEHIYHHLQIIYNATPLKELYVTEKRVNVLLHKTQRFIIIMSSGGDAFGHYWMIADLLDIKTIETLNSCSTEIAKNATFFKNSANMLELFIEISEEFAYLISIRE